MIQKSCLILGILYSSIYSFAQVKPLYFDKNLKETVKSDAVYFRPLPLAKLGNLELLTDYYMKEKTIKRQGYIADGNPENYVGDVFWFDAEGKANPALHLSIRPSRKSLRIILMMVKSGKR